MQLPEEILTALLTDPVMSAKVLMGWDLDAYQAAALRIDWWVPNTIDDSGTGTGKTFRIFIYAALRALLIPNHQVGIYFHNFTVARDEFWPYFEKTVMQSEFFAEQLKPVHGKLGESLRAGSLIMEFKNGSRIIVPAPGMKLDGANQEGRTFNTVIVDEWRRCEEAGDAIAKQIVERARGEEWNPHHPIWCNHLKFKGHAEGAVHKSHKRVREFKREIKQGSTMHAVYSFCYRDIGFRGYSAKGKPRYDRIWIRRIRKDRLIRMQRASLSADRFHCQILGIGAMPGEAFYPIAILERCYQHGIEPMIGREREQDIHVLGFDAAPGASLRADYSSPYVLRLRKIEAATRRNPRPAHTEQPTFLSPEFGNWHIASVYSYTLRGKGAPETSGFIHWLHQRFNFSKIVMDPGAGGGGWWIYKELRKPDQFWNGHKLKNVIPFSDALEGPQSDKLPIVHWFKRSSAVGRLSFVHQQHLTSDNGLIYAVHLRFQEAWNTQQIALPYPAEQRTKPPIWTPDQKVAMETIQKGVLQLTKVQQKQTKDGEVLTSKGTAWPMFRAVGRKDIAYAKMYAFCAAMLEIERQALEVDNEADVKFSIL